MNKIYEYRKANNFTQDDLAFYFNRAGLKCSNVDVSRWERGKCIPSSDARYVIADVLKVSEYDLLVDIILNLDYKHYRATQAKRQGLTNGNTG